MMTIRRASDRLHSNFGWLDSHHTFSFGHHHDPNHMGFRALRVINDDRVSAGKGFGTHPHRDMEILSYVLSGAMEHKDSMGTGSVIRSGDVQRMSAGTGVTHSEFNHSAAEPVHFLQIWLLPTSRGLKPGYDQKHFPEEARRGALMLVASPDGRGGSLSINSDVDLYAGLVDGDEVASLKLNRGGHAWVHVASGSVKLGAHVLEAGDGVAIEDAKALTFTNGHEANVLVFDLG